MTETPSVHQTLPIPLVGITLEGVASCDELQWALWQKHASVVHLKTIVTRGLDWALSSELSRQAKALVSAHRASVPGVSDE